MKTKSRNLIISFMLTLAMLLGIFAMTPLTASAAAINAMTTDDEEEEVVEIPEEPRYTGGGSSPILQGLLLFLPSFLRS